MYVCCGACVRAFCDVCIEKAKEASMRKKLHLVRSCVLKRTVCGSLSDVGWAARVLRGGGLSVKRLQRLLAAFFFMTISNQLDIQLAVTRCSLDLAMVIMVGHPRK